MALLRSWWWPPMHGFPPRSGGAGRRRAHQIRAHQIQGWHRSAGEVVEPVWPDRGRGVPQTDVRSGAMGIVASLTCVTVDPSGSGKEHAGARAWRRIWALRVREWELIGTLV